MLGGSPGFDAGPPRPPGPLRARRRERHHPGPAGARDHCDRRIRADRCRDPSRGRAPGRPPLVGGRPLRDRLEGAPLPSGRGGPRAERGPDWGGPGEGGPRRAGGGPSVSGIGAALGSADFAEVAARAAGVFGLFVHDKRRGGWQVAVDNAGLYKIFPDDRSASTSFLALARARRTGRADLDLPVMLEFLAQGQVLGPRTFVAGIDKLPGRELLELPADGSPARRRAKALPDP